MELMSAIHTDDAYKLLALELEAYRALSYFELAQLAGQSFVHRRTLGNRSAEYEVTIHVRGISSEGDRILVEGSIGSVVWGSSADRFDDHFFVEPPTGITPPAAK